MCLFLFVTLCLTAFLKCSVAISLQKPIPTTVNKCCSAGKILTREKYQCIIGSNDLWWPLIFQVMKQSYFEPQGLAPKFIKYREWRPYCKNPDFYEGSHKMALFSNGSLYLSEKHKFIKPKDFCVDKDTAIVCDPDINSLVHTEHLLKVRKCCVESNVYKAHENTCTPSHGFTFTDGRILESTQSDILFGFPECKNSKYFTIAEIFKESSLNRETNRLVLETGRKLGWEDFCLEHVDNGNDKILPLSVFTCGDHLAVPHNTDEFSHTVNSLLCLKLIEILN